MLGAFIWGVGFGLLLPKGLRYLRNNPGALRSGVERLKRFITD